MKEYYEIHKLMENKPKICVNCGATENIEIHHIVPLSMGGSNTPENVVYLCMECHYKAHGANIGRYGGKRSGRPKAEKPDNAELVIEKYLRGEISGLEGFNLLGLKRGKKFTKIWFVEEYLKEKGIKEVIHNHGSQKHQSVILRYSDGKIEHYEDGVYTHKY